jgi:hypothetical protein
MEFKPLPILYKENGDIRTAGFEIEYGNLGIEETVQIIRNLYGGRLVKESEYSQKVKDTTLGDFKIEFDLTLLTAKRYKKVLEPFNIQLQEVKMGEGTLEQGVEKMLEGVLGKIFPYEIAAPPIPVNQLEQLERLREELQKHDAEGTGAFPTNAFGTHINVELPDTGIETILKYLRAFLLLYPWLLEVGQTDIARRISPFINPFPEEYSDLVLSHGYRPDLEILIDDYHRCNPDRNRPLDMYPLFAALREDKIREFKNIGKVKPRETFHYRLPNSSLSKPGWTLAEEWNNWVKVEELANKPEKLDHMRHVYFELKKNTLFGFEKDWVKLTEQWLN